jgi:hypothetical protein
LHISVPQPTSGHVQDVVRASGNGVEQVAISSDVRNQDAGGRRKAEVLERIAAEESRGGSG